MKELAKTYKEQRDNNKSKRASKDSVFFRCYNFIMQLRDLEKHIHEYGALVISVLEMSRKKEDITMKAISDSFNDFCEANKEYFGEDLNKYHTEAKMCLSKIAVNDNYFDTFDLKNLLRPKEMEYIKGQLGLTEDPTEIDSLKELNNRI